MLKPMLTSALALALIVSVPGLASAQDQTSPRDLQQKAAQQQAEKAQQQTPQRRSAQGLAFKASDLIGMQVKNGDEDLGEIEDLVIDINSGKVRYAALSFGGFLGVGDKLFAVPMEALDTNFGEEKKLQHFSLNVPKEKLKNAPGFDSENWPNLADPTWSKGVDKFYGVERRTAERDINVDVETE